MATKTITIKEDVYEVLTTLKKSGESFSKLLLRLANQINGQKLDRFFGMWDMEDEEFERIQKTIRNSEVTFMKKVDFD